MNLSMICGSDLLIGTAWPAPIGIVASSNESGARRVNLTMTKWASWTTGTGAET